MHSFEPTKKRRPKARKRPKPRRRAVSPHDHFFRFVFGQVEHARALLQELVGEAARLFDWATLRLEPGSYIDERLRGSMSDLLFSIRFRDSQHRALAYLVWEHQRNPYVYMPLRLLNYSGRALRDYTRSYGAIHGYLPPIIPILVYQGPGRWPGPVRLSELHHIPGEPDPPVFMDLHMVVRDIDDDSIPYEQLTTVARTCLRLLREAALGDLVIQHAKRIAEWIAEVHGNASDDDFEAIVTYILQASKEQDLMRNIYQHVSEEKKDDTMSIADWLHATGRAEGVEVGKAKGMAKGMAKLLLGLLRQRFGVVPLAARERIRAASIPELEGWASRLLTATSLDDVLADS
jgi:predicted transposase YdaD